VIIVDLGDGTSVDISHHYPDGYLAPTPECIHESGACVLCNPQLFRPSNLESKAISTDMITKKLLEAKCKYYSGKPIMSDLEYDRLETTLRAINPTAPVLEKVGSDV